MIQLRDYQNEARYQCNTLINAKRHPVLVMSTGSGKTKTACVIIEDQIKINKRIFVLCPQIEIFYIICHFPCHFELFFHCHFELSEKSL